MKRSTDRILTTHPGRLPDPANRDEVHAARNANDQPMFDALTKAGITEIVQRQKQIGVDIISDGEFWKARDQKYYASRAGGIEPRPLKPGEWPSILGFQEERHNPAFADFYSAFDRVGNTPRPGVLNPVPTEKSVIAAPLKALGPGAINHELELVKAGIAAAGASIDDCFFPVLGPGWLGHFVWNDYYKTDEEYVYAMAEFFKADYKTVVEAGFTLQIDDPGLCDKFAMFEKPLTIEEFRKHAALRLEATNWAIQGIAEENVRYHTCWGSWHTPHTTDLPFEHVIDLLLSVNAGAYSVEAADARHELDWKLWEEYKLPEGKTYIPGVIAHKTTTVEPPELVAERIIRYANLMGRENVIAGVDCGLGGRCYPDIGWAKLQSLVDGAALASKKLWGR